MTEFEEAKKTADAWQWANFNFDSFWEWLEKNEAGKNLIEQLSVYPRVKEWGREFYEDVTTRWPIEGEIENDNLHYQAWSNCIRIGMLYSFLVGLSMREQL